MGLWAKGFKRSETNIERKEDFFVPNDLLNNIAHDIYTINTGVIVNRYKTEFPKSRLDMSKSQIIWWAKFEDRHLSAINFAITDPSSEIYVIGGTRMSYFKISDYQTNIITERSNVKSSFIDTIRNIGRIGGYHARDLDQKEFLYMKRLIEYMSNFIKPKKGHGDLFYSWLNNDKKI